MVKAVTVQAENFIAFILQPFYIQMQKKAYVAKENWPQRQQGPVAKTKQLECVLGSQKHEIGLQNKNEHC